MIVTPRTTILNHSKPERRSMSPSPPLSLRHFFFFFHYGFGTKLRALPCGPRVTASSSMNDIKETRCLACSSFISNETSLHFYTFSPDVFFFCLFCFLKNLNRHIREKTNRERWGRKLFFLLIRSTTSPATPPPLQAGTSVPYSFRQ